MVIDIIVADAITVCEHRIVETELIVDARKQCACPSACGRLTTRQAHHSGRSTRCRACNADMHFDCGQVGAHDRAGAETRHERTEAVRFAVRAMRGVVDRHAWCVEHSTVRALALANALLTGVEVHLNSASRRGGT